MSKMIGTECEVGTVNILKSYDSYTLDKPRFGPDISEHNGVVNWEAISTEIDFAMLRAGYGTLSVDKQFHRNARECTRLGIPFGVYWFSYTGSKETAIIEAQKCLETISLYHIDYPVAFDWEDDSLRRCKQSGINITGKDLPTKFAEAFLSVVVENGYRPALYTNLSYLNQFFDVKLLDKYDLWYAQWPKGSPNLNSSPKPKGIEAAIWQYSATGRYPKAINGDVDMNVCYVDYPKMLNEEMNKLTADEIYDLLMKRLNFEKQKSWAEPEIIRAKEHHITDGSRPYEIASRAEVMTMINRAIDRILNTVLPLDEKFVTLDQFKTAMERAKEYVDRAVAKPDDGK